MLLQKLIKSLNGKIILIAGNHDKNNLDFYKKECGLEVYNYPIIIDDFWILSHEPMYVSQQSPYANIFAHVHNNPLYTTVSTRSYCVSAERISYKPINFKTIKQRILKMEE